MLRLIFSLALAAWAVNWVVAQAGANLEHEFKTCRWGWIGLSVTLSGAATAVSSYRWSRLLALQQVFISHWDAFRLIMMGGFFNLFGLGGVGGDIFKMYYVRSPAGDRKEEAMLSILVDRIIGLLGLFMVALASLPFVWHELMSAPASIQSMTGFVVLVSLVSGGGVTLVLSRELLPPTWTKEWASKMSSIHTQHHSGFAAKVLSFLAKVADIAAKLVRSLDLYREQLPQLLKMLVLSAVVHSLATLAVICVGQAFDVQGLAPRFYFLGVQVANTISAIPITPSGLGSRDLVLSAFFKFGGADARRGLIPFGLSCTIVFWSLVGGIFFVTAKRSGEVHPDPKEEPQLKEGDRDP